MKINRFNEMGSPNKRPKLKYRVHRIGLVKPMWCFCEGVGKSAYTDKYYGLYTTHAEAWAAFLSQVS